MTFSLLKKVVGIVRKKDKRVEEYKVNIFDLEVFKNVKNLILCFNWEISWRKNFDGAKKDRGKERSRQITSRRVISIFK